MDDPDYKRLWLQASDAYDRKNRSGCVCAIDPDTDTIRSPCAMHAEWRAEAVAAERERWMEACSAVSAGAEAAGRPGAQTVTQIRLLALGPNARLTCLP